MKRIISTAAAPPPAGAYAQAVAASGSFVFVSGQTPRLADGTRLVDVPFEQQARQALENVRILAAEAGCDLSRDCVQLGVFLRDMANRATFDTVMAEFTALSPPARWLVQSDIPVELQVQAVLVCP